MVKFVDGSATHFFVVWILSLLHEVAEWVRRIKEGSHNVCRIRSKVVSNNQFREDHTVIEWMCYLSCTFHLSFFSCLRISIEEFSLHTH